MSLSDPHPANTPLKPLPEQKKTTNILQAAFPFVYSHEL